MYTHIHTMLFYPCKDIYDQKRLLDHNANLKRTRNSLKASELIGPHYSYNSMHSEHFITAPIFDSALKVKY